VKSQALIETSYKWAMRLLVTLLVAIAAGLVVEGVYYLVTLARYGEFLDITAGLFVFQAVLGCVAIIASWSYIARQRLAVAAAVLLLPIPVQFLVAANRCDFDCRSSGWASLPQGVVRWRIPLRKHPAPAPVQLVRHLTRHLNVHPSGAALPPSFLDQAAKADLGGVSTCFGGADAETCDAYLMDIYGSGESDVLTVSPTDQHDNSLAAEIFTRGKGGAWRRSGEITVTCAASMQAFREGRFQLSPAKVRDVVLAGRQFSLLLDPDYGCPELGGRAAPLH
jgi:hypothetical protein